MLDSLKKLRILNGNILKILAAITMFIDHFGLLFFPYNMTLRAIGRIAMPLFAFMIAEGARYTRNKTKHFLMLFGLGAICQIVYFFFSGDTYLNILLTFSLSTLILYALENFKNSFGMEKSTNRKIALPIIQSALLFILSILFAYIICKLCVVDYGFWGCMMPVFANLVDFRSLRNKLGESAPKWLEKIDVLPLRIACFTVCMVLFHFLSKTPLPTAWMFLTVPLLLLYTGERGKAKMKYFFYLFYPLHLALLEGIFMLTYFL